MSLSQRTGDVPPAASRGRRGCACAVRAAGLRRGGFRSGHGEAGRAGESQGTDRVRGSEPPTAGSPLSWDGASVGPGVCSTGRYRYRKRRNRYRSRRFRSASHTDINGRFVWRQRTGAGSFRSNRTSARSRFRFRFGPS